MATPVSTEKDEKQNDVPSWQLAKQGIKLLINNKPQDAEALFKMYPENLHMSAGYAYAIFTDALMSFEDEKIHLAVQMLKELEKKCSSYSGWMRSVKFKMFGSENSSYTEQLESQIILADSHVFVATLTFLQQDISGYFKGGWILRKSYKHYQQAYNEILELYNEIVGDNNVPSRMKLQKPVPERETLNKKPFIISDDASKTDLVDDLEMKNADEEKTITDIKEDILSQINSETGFEVNRKTVPKQSNPETSHCILCNVCKMEAHYGKEHANEDIQEPIENAVNIEIPEQVNGQDVNTEICENAQDDTEIIINRKASSERNSEIELETLEKIFLTEVTLLDAVDAAVEDLLHCSDCPCETTPAATSSLARNGYIPNHSRKPNSALPKHSISCHSDLSACSVTSNHINPNTALKFKFCAPNEFSRNSQSNTPCTSRSVTASISVSDTRTTGLPNNSFLKKSASVNNSLSNPKEFQRRSTSFTDNLSYFTSTFNIFSSKPLMKDIDADTLRRLLCAVSFGYGLLQLGISLLPPSVLKVTSFLGFGGNRKSGLDNLMYARLGNDMRAPFATWGLSHPRIQAKNDSSPPGVRVPPVISSFAREEQTFHLSKDLTDILQPPASAWNITIQSLALLWYHTIVRPFYALDGTNVQAGVAAAAQLIEETKEEYGKSALFLFFKGRVERLNSDIAAAIEAFQSAIEKASQHEIKMMSMHEVGWCYMIALDYTQSESTFHRLKQSSRWSKAFYSYLAVISAGANNMFREVRDACELRNIFQSVPKGTQLDEFLNRRHTICPTGEKELRETSTLFWKMLVYELLYLWNTLPSCTRENISKIIDDCGVTSETSVEPVKGLSKLIEGSCHCILRDFETGIFCFKSAVELRKGLSSSSESAHVSAFAQYELGLLLIKTEQSRSEGKKLLQTTANYKGYDFEQRLSVRIHTVLKNL